MSILDQGFLPMTRTLGFWIEQRNLCNFGSA